MTAEKRRQYRSGAIYFDASKNLWIGAIEVGSTIQGSRRRVRVSAKTEAACKRAVSAKRDELARTGAVVTGIEPRTTVEQWANRWLALTSIQIRPKSWATNASQVHAWIIPVIGKKRLDRLTPADLRMVGEAILTGTRQLDGKTVTLSSSTAHRAHAVMRKMLRDALVEGHQIPPRLLEVPAPRLAVADRDAIPVLHVERMLKAASTPYATARWAAAFLQGMRQGECLGLTWDRVDLVNATLDVSWQLQALPYRHGCAEPCGRRYAGDCPDRQIRLSPGYEARHLVDAMHLVRPKTAKGTRVIPMSPWMLATLTQWRDEAPDNEWLLVWSHHGKPVRPEDDRDQWYALQDAAQVSKSGRRYHLHEARHTTATLLLEAGVDPEVVKAIIGHSNITTTRGYQHVSQSMARKALADVADRLQLQAGGR